MAGVDRGVAPGRTPLRTAQPRRDAASLLPDLLRLLKRLASDKSLPHDVRVRLWLLLVYLAVRIDLIPDFIPVIGYAADEIIVALALALRSMTRRAGPQALQRHWPGNPAGLVAVLRAAGIRD
jgi:uncharacterized membrane protein YkvA (DUF1232 family)